jgi:NAD(P)-dependent dehydrogenase (short-subunit alcohol dehydrogenase family)
VTKKPVLDLDGKRALVTGAGQGVGSAIVSLLAAAGANVAINDIVPARAEEQASRIRADGGLAVAAPFDVTDFDAVTSGVDGIGDVDILVNNAGNAGGDAWPAMAPFVETTPDDWQAFLAVNLHGVMHCIRAVLPSMIRSGWGRIVTVISDAARVGEPMLAAYAAAKAGAAGLTRSVAAEVGRYGVTANNVALGTVRTERSEEFWAGADDSTVAARLRGYAIRRPGEPADAAALVGFLVSPSASWITGQTIPVNGGYSMAL